MSGVEALKQWNAALKKWNENKDKWCSPRKGSPEYNEVVALIPAKAKAKAKAEAKSKKIERMRTELWKLEEESDKIADIEREMGGELPPKYQKRDSDLYKKRLSLMSAIQTLEEND